MNDQNFKILLKIHPFALLFMTQAKLGYLYKEAVPAGKCNFKTGRSNPGPWELLSCKF